MPIQDVILFHLLLPGERRLWDTWKAFEEATSTFLSLSVGPDIVSDEDIAVLERFTILLYDRTSTLVSVDECRKFLFTKRGRAMNPSYQSSP